MNIIPLEFSIVVVGQDCNPTILNPDFLKHREIVQEEWGWKVAGPAITTPPFATVSYDSGVTIKVDPTRFQVSDNENAGDIGQSKAIEVAKRYIAVLPHVRYTGVGINFRILAELNDPEAFLKERFLKSGPWSQESNPLLGINLTFVYPYEDGRLNISLQGSALVRPEGEKAEKIQGVLAHANYHRDCQGYPTDKIVLAHIGRAVNDEKNFGASLARLLDDAAE